MTHHRMLRTNSRAVRKEFRLQQRMVKREVDKIREEWIKRVAMEGETAMKDGRTRWESIRKLQQADAEHRQVKPSAVRNEDRELAQVPLEVPQRWHQHFSKLLNQLSEFNCDVIE